MPAEGLPWLPGEKMLTTAELLRLVGIAVECGVDSVRLTGGEPLLRPDVVDVVAGVAALGVEVSMTTNGLRLPGLAAPLRDA
ncbi:MAG: radical SAM protein, partial [Candidatus Nanopelagicales bacterium]|nr:radical SAM protein [Candidatus Nanopelagicales bacterium]